MRRLVTAGLAWLVVISMAPPLVSPVASQPSTPAQGGATPDRGSPRGVGVTGSVRAPRPPTPPPPDLARIVPWVAAPLDKPVVEVPRLALPPSPMDIPTVPPATVALPEAQKPTESLPAPRTLSCVGAFFRIAAESLECGRVKLSRGDLEEAARSFEQASRPGTEPEVVVEARYWHAETLYRLGQFERADWLFRQVTTDPKRGPLALWAVFGSGFTALQLGDPARAEDAFRRVLGVAHPVALEGWARHGLALALYAQGRWSDADKMWSEATARRMSPALERDILFWHGDTQGRVGQPRDAAEKLARFTQGGPHRLLVPGLVRLGWWSLAASKPAEAVKALRAALPSAPTAGEGAREREWAETGLALALIAAGDGPGARIALAPLEGRRSALSLPVRLRLLADAVATGKSSDALALSQELLSSNLPPPLRAWVLLAKGEAHRIEGNRDEARTQFELARDGSPSSDVGRHAVLRLAQVNFDLREFSQAVTDVTALLAEPIAPDMRATALLLQGEAAYHAGNYTVASEADRRFLVEFPDHAQAPAVRLALAWTALRQGQRDDALRQFLEFAKAHPTDAHAVDALVLASELQLSGGSPETARALLDRIVTDHGGHPRAELARFNRALLLLRSGQPLAAQRDLAAWIARAPFPPLLGRAYAALGIALLAQNRPGDAAREFMRAQREGVSDLASLGLGSSALEERRWDEAVRDFTQARDNGTPPVAAAAEYGLAVVAFHRGKTAEFKTAAQATLDAAPQGTGAPRLLYALTTIAVDEREWPGALALARRLVTDFPDDEAADDGLERVGAGAATAGAWPVAYEAYALMRERYPKSPFVEGSRQAFGRALLETNRPQEARQVLEPLAAAGPADPRGSAESWLLLGRAREAGGDSAGALDAFSRAERSGTTSAWPTEALFAYARLLSGERRSSEARVRSEERRVGKGGGCRG